MVNCEALEKGDEKELKMVKKQLHKLGSVLSQITFFIKSYHIVDAYSSNFYVSPEEKNFPVAYNNVRQVLRLLKVIYRLHNLYCIHPEAKQEPKFIRAFLAISQCLDNVFVASHRCAQQ